MPLLLTQADPHPRFVPKVLACTGGITGVAVLAGWTFDVDPLKALVAGFPAMLPWTALSIVLGGLGLWLAASGRPGLRACCVAPAAVLLVVAAIPMLERQAHVDLGTDLLLFPHKVIADGVSLGLNPGRMGQATTVALLGLAAALLLFPCLNGRLARAAFSTLATIALAPALIALLGYVLGLELLDDALLDGRLAIHAALALATLAVGTLALRPDVGWVRSANEQGVAGWSAAGLLGTAALLLLVGSDAATRAGQIATNASDATLRYEVLISILKDAETGQRGYLLTGKPDYLEPYETARRQLPDELASVNALSVADPGALAELLRLPQLTTDKMAELAETIALYRRGDAAGALAVVQTGRGKRLMDEIRKAVTALIGAHAGITRDSGAKARRAAVFASVGAVALTGIAFWGLAITARVRRASLQMIAEKEARQRELIATLDLGTFITRDRSGVIQYWSEGCVKLYGWTAAEARGCMLHDLLQTQFPGPFPEIEAILERSGAWTGDLRQRTRDGRILVVTARKMLHVNAIDQSAVILEVVTDVTEQRQAELALRDNQALLRTVIETAPGPIYAKDREGRMLLANSKALSMIGKPWHDINGQTDADFRDNRAQADAAAASDRRVMEANQSETVEEAFGQSGGQAQFWLSTKTPMSNADGQVIGVVGVSVEITELKRIEDRLGLMINELNHRVKNTLATVQSISLQTLRRVDPGIRQTLEARLQALAAAHDVLTRQEWEGADLHAIIEGALMPIGGRTHERVRVAGPPIRLQPRAAVALSMGLHELMTNALKFGALSKESGQVAIEWAITQTDEACLHLVWTERGGPSVTAPARRGFGTRLIERGLAQDLGGTARLAFAFDGVTCTIDAPLTEVTVTAQVMSFPRVGTIKGF